MATLGPGTPVAYTGVSTECCEPQAHGNTPVGSLAVVTSIIPESEATCGHVVVVRTQEGHTATARPDEVKPLDDWGVSTRDGSQVQEPASA
jgi:hypothetical protein